MAMAADGECAFEDLRTRARRGYACDNTVDIEDHSFDDARNKLIKHVGNCIHRLEEGSGLTVMKFYIGKTYVNKKQQQPGGEDLPLDPQDNSTYTKDGISKHWGDEQKTDYGRDGTVVLTTVTEKAVPQARRPLDLEDYTLELKKALFDYFTATSPYKEKIANKHPTKGRRRGSPAYALCMAYSLEEESSEEGVKWSIEIPETSGNESKVEISVEDSKEAKIQQLTEQLHVCRLKPSS